jgi:diadenosine tetraphosphate (Ap4A) HIT family hydrolase
MSWVFCAIVAGEAAAIPIYEDDNYLAILDIRPFTRGHTLGRRLVKGWGSAARPLNS